MSACLFSPAGLAELLTPSVLGCLGEEGLKENGLSATVKGQPLRPGSEGFYFLVSFAAVAASTWTSGRFLVPETSSVLG